MGPSARSAVLGISFGRVRFVAVTLYPVIVSPPSVVGASKSAMIEAAPGVAVTSVGALGRGAGVTASDGSDAALVPALFVAVTVNVYDWRLVSPSTAQAMLRVSQVSPPGAAVTV